MKNSLPSLAVGCLMFCSLNAASSECPIIENGPVIEARPFLGLKRDLNCTYVSQVEKILAEIQHFSESPLRVNLLVRTSYGGASYDGGLNLEVPEQLVYAGDWGQEYGVSIYSNLAVVAHEYGHALLQDKLEKDLSAKYPVVKEYSLAKKELSRIEMELAKDPNSEELKQQLKEKTAQMLNNKEFTKFFVLVGPYSELYADVVAVFNENNKSAIFNALYYDQIGKFAFRMIHTRTFDSIFDAKYEVFMTEAHGYFAHTRSYIGKDLWPEDMNEKKEFLSLIGEAIVAEISRWLGSDSGIPEFQEGNKALISKLDELKNKRK